VTGWIIGNEEEKKSVFSLPLFWRRKNKQRRPKEIESKEAVEKVEEKEREFPYGIFRKFEILCWFLLFYDLRILVGFSFFSSAWLWPLPEKVSMVLFPDFLTNLILTLPLQSIVGCSASFPDYKKIACQVCAAAAGVLFQVKLIERVIGLTTL